MSSPEGVTPSPAEEAIRRFQAAREQAEVEREAQHEATLASDSDREQVCTILNSAFSEGRLTSTELDDRTSRALAARTFGQLDDVLDGLGGVGVATHWATTPRQDRGIVPRILFWVVGLVTAPFVLIGSLVVLFGSGFGTKVFGLVLLVLFLPGLVALYRWAHPRT